MNKLLSRSADKLAKIELRAQEDRGDESDSSRAITTYLLKHGDFCNEDYIKEGVRRLAKSWLESRKIQKDLPQRAFHAAWDGIRQQGFHHAYQHFQDVATKARTLGYFSDAGVAEEVEKKLRNVYADPAERQMLEDSSMEA